MSGPVPIRWGFLGAGFVASKGMAPAVHAAAGAVLQAVGARDAGRAAALEPAASVGSYAEICARDDVDAVYVSLPNNDHLHWVQVALEAGKHVLCEKPLGMDAAEVAVMRSAADRSDRLLVEAAWNRWHPRTRRIDELVAPITGPREVRAWFTFSGVPADNYRLDPARGGGALLDVGCYTVAAALAALGAGAVGVSGVERHLGPTGVDLTTAAVLTHANGSATDHGVLRAPRGPGPDHRGAGAVRRVRRPGLHDLARAVRPAGGAGRRRARGAVRRLRPLPAHGRGGVGADPRRGRLGPAAGHLRGGCGHARRHRSHRPRVAMRPHPVAERQTARSVLAHLKRPPSAADG